jgi:hypothetical protein
MRRVFDLKPPEEAEASAARAARGPRRRIRRADAIRVDTIARELEEIQQQRLDDCRIELFEQDNK